MNSSYLLAFVVISLLRQANRHSSGEHILNFKPCPTK